MSNDNNPYADYIGGSHFGVVNSMYGWQGMIEQQKREAEKRKREEESMRALIAQTKGKSQY